MLWGAVVLTVAGGAWAEARGASRRDPLRPDSPTQIVGRVRARGGAPGRAQRLRLRAEMAVHPRDETGALALAHAYVTEARRSGDPRALGRAEAVLAPWWEERHPPAGIWLLRATIKQSRHDFLGAMADLEALLASTTAAEPDQQATIAQASLTRAVVLGVLGRHAEGLASCEGLARTQDRFLAAACRAPLLGATGHIAAAEAALVDALSANGEEGAERSAGAPAHSLGARAWAQALHGELAGWRGEGARAEHHLAAVLAMDPDDRYARLALADLWLDETRPRDVLALLRGREDDDGALLRLALAAKAARDSRATSWADTLAARFKDARARGDALHAREESRAALALEGDARRALALAEANWRVQREPADARVFLEAAVAAHDPRAAAPVLAWLAETHFEGARVRALAAALAREP